MTLLSESDRNCIHRLNEETHHGHHKKKTIASRAAALASPAKKSELLRAGIKALAAMSDSAFVAALKAVPAIKTGRPAKSS